MKFLLEAKPKWLFIGFVTLILGVLPFAASSAGVVTNDLAQGDPEPEVITVQLAPRPHDHATPTPTSIIPPVIVEQPTIVIEQPDLAPILEAIAAIENGQIDLDALTEAIASAMSDLQFTIELTIDGEPTIIVCDTRGATCEEPPFGRE